MKRFVKGKTIDTLPLENDFTLIRFMKPGDQVEQSRLAGPVGTDQAGDAVRRYVHADAADGFQAAEALVNIS